MKNLLFALAFAASVFFAGCGEMGGGYVENNNTYNLESWSRKSFKMDIEGYLKDETQTVNLTGFLSNTYLGKDTYNGVSVDKGAGNIEIDFENGFSIMNESTSYANGGFDLHSIDSENVACHLVNEPSPLPSDASVGYVSDPAKYECDDLRSTNSTIEVQASGSTNAKIVVTVELYDDGTYIGSENHVYTLDPEMNLISFEVDSDYNGISLNMHSTSITQG